MSDPWQEMDDWCAKRAADLCEVAEMMLVESEYDTSERTYCVTLGQSQAFHQMRSFIHSARTRP